MRVLRILRTPGLAAGLVVFGLGLTSLILALYSVKVGITTQNQDTAGLAKLAFIVFIHGAGPLLGCSGIILLPTLILHLVLHYSSNDG